MKSPLCVVLLLATAGLAAAQVAPYKVVGDGIPKPLTGKPGDAARGKALLAGRTAVNCLQCHSVKRDKDLAGGERGPALDGVGSALTAAQLRLSVADYSRISRGAAMPSYHKAEVLGAGASLNAEQVEDVVAFLATLKSK